MVRLGHLCCVYAQSRACDGLGAWSSAKEVAGALAPFHGDGRGLDHHASVTHVYLKLMPTAAVVGAAFPGAAPGSPACPLGEASLAALFEFAPYAPRDASGCYAVGDELARLLAPILARVASGELDRAGARVALAKVGRPQRGHPVLQRGKPRRPPVPADAAGTIDRVVAAARGATPRDLSGLVLKMLGAHPDPEAARRALLAELAIAKVKKPLSWT